MRLERRGRQVIAVRDSGVVARMREWWAGLEQGRAMRAAERRARYENGTGVKFLDLLKEAFGGVKTSSGGYMTEEKAMTISAVFTAVRIISGTVASLPMHVYRRLDDGGRELDTKHWAYYLLHDSPSDYHTSFSWREVMMTHLLLWGDHFSRIEWLKNGSAEALYPIAPHQVEVYITDSGEKSYRVHVGGGKEDLPDDEMIHIPGLSFDGLRGMSVVGKMRDTFGLAKTAEDLAAKSFKNGPRVGMVLEVPARMKETAQENLAKSVADKYAGEEAFGVLVLEEGAKAHGPTTMPLRDAQFIENRKLSRSEIYGLFGLPPHLGGDTERSTSWGTGIEQQDIGYAKHTIRPWLERIEQELNRKLFGRGSGRYCKHNMDALMRGDFKSRMEGYLIAGGGAFLTRNEIRELEDWNISPEPGMDKVLTDLNKHAGATPPKPEKPAAGGPGGGAGGSKGGANEPNGDAQPANADAD